MEEDESCSSRDTFKEIESAVLRSCSINILASQYPTCIYTNAHERRHLSLVYRISYIRQTGFDREEQVMFHNCFGLLSIMAMKYPLLGAAMEGKGPARGEYARRATFSLFL